MHERTTVMETHLSIFILLLLFFSLHSQSVDESVHSIRQASPSNPYLTQPFQPQTSTTIPSFPTQWQSSSCLLDLTPQLLNKIKHDCWADPFISRAHCCPLLAAWLMAARAQVALKEAPTPEMPDMPVLPDDSMICVAKMKAVLETHGLHLSVPNAGCDVVSCFCGISLKDITVSNCATVSLQSSELYINSSSALSSIRALEVNCTEHSYRGCTKCLATLQEESEGNSTTRLVRWKNARELDCKLMEMMHLLAKNSTLYIPTVSTVLRAIMYSGHRETDTPHCSRDWIYLPLAVDSSQLQGSAAAAALGLMLQRSWVYSGIVLSVLFLSTLYR